VGLTLLRPGNEAIEFSKLLQISTGYQRLVTRSLLEETLGESLEIMNKSHIRIKPIQLFLSGSKI
jgi:hypothetical protein